MKETFEPSPDFVGKVMRRVHAYEAEQEALTAGLIWSRPLRYLLAGGGTVFGILTAAPVF